MGKLLYYFKHFDKYCSHHVAAVQELERMLPPELLEGNPEWMEIFEASESEARSIM